MDPRHCAKEGENLKKSKNGRGLSPTVVVSKQPQGKYDIYSQGKRRRARNSVVA